MIIRKTFLNLTKIHTHTHTLNSISRSKHKQPLNPKLQLQTFLGFRFAVSELRNLLPEHMHSAFPEGFATSQRPSLSPRMAAFGALSLCPYSLLCRPNPTRKRSVSCSLGSQTSIGRPCFKFTLFVFVSD